ncbi:MAG: dienelactone hydrolase family protein [Myxacorys californica WJT36-NPBG1]|jgi:dienelactone hydrolase|nr:dienelactone hydrolase family protein [Myxacorys californica WJT36-NPBG1]
MHDFVMFDFAEAGSSRRVYRKGEGPAVILMHELPGMIPECVDLARRIADAGFTVYLPLLFGQPDEPLSIPNTLAYTAQLCISQEFYCFAKHQSSPITTWLRALCRKAHEECGNRGVGVIGMCLTGGFVLSLMADESVMAPIVGQPALPFGITHSHQAALGISQQDLEAAKKRAEQGVPILALRFSEDKISPSKRFETLRQQFDDTPDVIEESPELCWRRGRILETIEINSKPGNPYHIPQNSHPTLTLGYRGSGHPTHRVLQRVLEFLQEQLSKQDET